MREINIVGLNEVFKIVLGERKGPGIRILRDGGCLQEYIFCKFECKAWFLIDAQVHFRCCRQNAACLGQQGLRERGSLRSRGNTTHCHDNHVSPATGDGGDEGGRGGGGGERE